MENYLEIIQNFVSKNLTTHFIFTLLIGALVGGILDRYIFIVLWKKLDVIYHGEPLLILNVTEVERWPSDGKLEGPFVLLFVTQNGEATLVAARTGDARLNKLYGSAPTPRDLISCEECIEYSFSVKNIGSASAKNVSIDLLSISELKLIDTEKDPKISNANCGGILSSQGCRIEIKLLGKGGAAFFSGIAKSSGIRKTDCSIDGDNKGCLVNYRHHFVQKIFPQTTFIMNSKRIKFPPLHLKNELTQYHYQPDTNDWAIDSAETIDGAQKDLTKEQLIKLLKNANSRFDVSSLPDNAIIHDARIQY